MTWEHARKRLDTVILAVDDDDKIVGEIEEWTYDGATSSDRRWKAEPLGEASRRNGPRVCDSLEAAKAYIVKAQEEHHDQNDQDN